MRVDEFDFDLPEALIALAPTPERDGGRLLHVAGGRLADRMVRELPALVRPGDVLVLNDTAVIPAQLAGVRAARDASGRDIAVDVTLHKRSAGDEATGAGWDAFVRPGKRIREGDRLTFAHDFYAGVLARDGAEARLRFNVGGAAFDAALAATGAPPLPPYIARKRALNAADAARYQTVYADAKGSVAAPTAGLHFTDDLLARVEASGASIERVTLHVGAGTFLPVTASDTGDHKMHAEWGEITADAAAAINAARARGGRIIAVGTTSLRLLESATDDDGVIHPFTDETDIFITPGYRFKAVDALMTNFHLPKSTLFMLVAALAGTAAMKAAYAHAIKERYRFYSYGDACFLERSA
ncbi:MAG: tRNA preQ1(34) S-adenosylmethionine ribosyltransferase-isomerase QueA [Pseudomonadota bacterium]